MLYWTYLVSRASKKPWIASSAIGLPEPSRLALLDESQLLSLRDLLVPNELRVHALLRHVLRLLHPLDAVSVGFVVLVLIGVVLGLGHFEGSRPIKREAV